MTYHSKSCQELKLLDGKIRGKNEAYKGQIMRWYVLWSSNSMLRVRHICCTSNLFNHFPSLFPNNNVIHLYHVMLQVEMISQVQTRSLHSILVLFQFILYGSSQWENKMKRVCSC